MIKWEMRASVHLELHERAEKQKRIKIDTLRTQGRAFTREGLAYVEKLLRSDGVRQMKRAPRY